jgi:hypothetical protein
MILALGAKKNLPRHLVIVGLRCSGPTPAANLDYTVT